jgi:hypothetical protein
VSEKEPREISDETLKEILFKRFDIDALLSDIENTPWEKTEPHRVEQLSYIGPSSILDDMAEEIFDVDTDYEFLNELSDDILSALSQILDANLSGAFATLDSGDVFAGRYLEGPEANTIIKGLE